MHHYTLLKKSIHQYQLFKKLLFQKGQSTNIPKYKYVQNYFVQQKKVFAPFGLKFLTVLYYELGWYWRYERKQIQLSPFRFWLRIWYKYTLTFDSFTGCFTK